MQSKQIFHQSQEVWIDISEDYWILYQKTPTTWVAPGIVNK